jgi:stearoyl-CoA desaturase (delta-9 desaturase)
MHRYAAHADFKMNKFWERFFYIFAYITQGSSYLSARVYGILHRMHHAYTDTPKDPHSPKYFSNLFTMMRATAKIYSDIFDGIYPVEERFTKNLPDWPSLDKWAQSLPSRLMFGVLYLAFYIHFAHYWWLYLLLPVQIMISPVHGAVINWFAHKYGYRNFDLNNTSRNIMPLDIFMLGEGYHNNHHKYASSINFGVRWFEIDPVYYIILFFSLLGIVHIKPKSERRVVSEF